MCGVGADLGVVAADHRDSAAQDAGLDDVSQRLERAEGVDVRVAHAVELFLNGLDRVADTGLGLEVRNVDKLGLAVFEVFNRHADDRLGVVRRSVLMELNEIGVRHAGDGGGGDELGMEMHCTSTTMASQAPVRTTFSCCRKLPAIGMP